MAECSYFGFLLQYVLNGDYNDHMVRAAYGGAIWQMFLKMYATDILNIHKLTKVII